MIQIKIKFKLQKNNKPSNNHKIVNRLLYKNQKIPSNKMKAINTISQPNKINKIKLFNNHVYKNLQYGKKQE